jgi:hypothetical protein
VEAGSLPAPRTPKLLLGLPLGLLAALIGVLLAVAVMFGASPSCGGGEAVGALSSKVPKRLLPIYEQAAAKYGLGEEGPSILAGINWVETGFGTNLGVSSAEAEGWMQFLPSSWEAFGVDGNGDGTKDPYNAWDAIFAAGPPAARFGRSAGLARGDLQLQPRRVVCRRGPGRRAPFRRRRLRRGGECAQRDRRADGRRGCSPQRPPPDL